MVVPEGNLFFFNKLFGAAVDVRNVSTKLNYIIHFTGALGIQVYHLK